MIVSFKKKFILNLFLNCHSKVFQILNQFNAKNAI